MIYAVLEWLIYARELLRNPWRKSENRFSYISKGLPFLYDSPFFMRIILQNQSKSNPFSFISSLTAFFSAACLIPLSSTNSSQRCLS